MDKSQLITLLNTVKRIQSQPLTVEDSATWASDVALGRVVYMDNTRSRDHKRVVQLFVRSVYLVAICHGEFIAPPQDKYWWHAWNAETGAIAFGSLPGRSAQYLDACVVDAISHIEAAVRKESWAGAAYFDPNGVWRIEMIQTESIPYIETTYGDRQFLFPMSEVNLQEEGCGVLQILFRMMRSRGIEPSERS